MFDLVGFLIGLFTVAFFIAIVYFMTGKGYVVRGLIPILVIVIITIVFGTICQNKVDQYKLETKTYPAGANTATVLVKRESSGNVVAFSHAYISNSLGQILDVVVINGNIPSKPYQKLIDDILSSTKLDGISEDINSIKKEVAYFTNAEIAPIDVYIFGSILTLMLIGIYALRLKIFRTNKLRKELKKIKLDSI